MAPKRNFDISLSSLQFMPGAEQLFTPSNCQQLHDSPRERARLGELDMDDCLPRHRQRDLREGANAVTSAGELACRLPAMSPPSPSATGKIETVPVSRFDFVGDGDRARLPTTG
jgi:hypothetical protein